MGFGKAKLSLLERIRKFREFLSPSGIFGQGKSREGMCPDPGRFLLLFLRAKQIHVILVIPMMYV
jgi:hypothetical protein